MAKKSQIVLGTWAWGDNGSYFGNHFDEDHFKPVYDEALKDGLNIWDTAYAYGGGASETILGDLAAKTPRENIVISTKFTPQMEDGTANAMENMLEAFEDRLCRLLLDS